MTRTPPVPVTETPGSFQTAALWNAQVSGLNTFALGPPRFSGYQATVQSVANNVWVSLLIDTEVLDSDAGHSTVTNTSRYTATVPGTYLAIGTAGWSNNATGIRRVRLTLNGALIIGAATGTDTHAAGSGVIGEHVSTLVVMNGTTDYVEVQGYQTSGAALNTSANSDFTSSLRLLWIST